jgi:hypothetical protein
VTKEINDGLNLVANDLGMSKSRAVRFICMDYLSKNNLLPEGKHLYHQHL